MQDGWEKYKIKQIVKAKHKYNTYNVNKLSALLKTLLHWTKPN